MLRKAAVFQNQRHRARPLASRRFLEHRQTALEDREAFGQAVAEYSAHTQVVDLEGGKLRLSPTQTVDAMTLWNSARVARSSPAARAQFKTCVVGGSDAIRRIWHDYGVRPTCVFVPDDEEVPDWCHSSDKPTLVVRADARSISTSLLSSTHSEPCGAEFPLPIMPSLLDLVSPQQQGDSIASPPALLSRVLVMHRTRNPSNIGAMMRCATAFKYDAVVMDHSADAFNEKVLRESLGAVFNPNLKVFTLTARDGSDSAAVLQQAAVAHRLLPIFAVPDPTAEPVFRVAQRLHYFNCQQQQQKIGGEEAGTTTTTLGAMIVLGSEAQGLAELQNNWAMPAKLAGIALDNPVVDSMNVAHAASIILHHFRPAAAAEFDELVARGIKPLAADSDGAPDALESLAQLVASGESPRALQQA